MLDSRPQLSLNEVCPQIEAHGRSDEAGCWCSKNVYIILCSTNTRNPARCPCRVVYPVDHHSMNNASHPTSYTQSLKPSYALTLLASTQSGSYRPAAIFFSPQAPMYVIAQSPTLINTSPQPHSTSSAPSSYSPEAPYPPCHYSASAHHSLPPAHSASSECQTALESH